MAVRIGALLLLALVGLGCGGESESSGQESTSDPIASSDADSADSADDTDGDPGTAGSGARGSVSVAGATYEFTDVAECEVGGDWGPDWRSFIAWTDDGHTFTKITVATGDDAWLTGFNLSVGLANSRTLDEGNPDEEWTNDYGGSVTPSLTDAGATGTAEVTTLGLDGATDAVADWSFTC